MSGSETASIFHVSDGHIIDPTGAVFVARGIDVMEGNQPSVSTLQSDFPGINFVRLAMYDYADPASLSSYVDSLTSAGIVVELEDHTNSNGTNAGGNQGTIYTGQQLTNELNWYSSVASAFKGNAYVWFGTNNEPSETDASGNNDPAALSSWQEQTYDAIRNTGNTNPIMLEAVSFGVDKTNAGYTASDYAAMTNTVWDVHYYGWLSNYSTDQTTVSQTLTDIVGEAQQITSADGTMPVIIGEYGNSTTGASIDANGDQVITAVQDSGYGAVAWAYAVGNPGDGLVNSDGSLSSYGQQIAEGIAAADKAATSSSSGATSTSSSAASTTKTASASGSVIAAGSTAALTDAGGNQWTITSTNAVDENGAAAGYSANVKEVAYVNGTIWQENTDNLWWSWDGSAWSSESTTTNPLASANNTVVSAGSSSSITDADGDTWTITSAAAVDENGSAAGYSSNVKEIAYVDGDIWQENSAGLWWEWNGTAWSGNGTQTSPLSSSST